MAHGGPRVGSGRPRGKLKPVAVAADIVKVARKSGLTPLDYMLMVIQDENAPPEDRMRMAVSAAPYVHPKLIERTTGGGKKEQATQAALTAGKGSEWGSDLAGAVN